MKVETLLGLPEALEIVSGDVSEKGITLIVISTQANPCCPLCGTSASRVHSHYSRQLSDAPCAGRLVHLILHVRKFFCDEPTCARKIFVERLAPFAQPWARVTARLCQMAEAVGLATGGRLGERLTDRLGMPTCWMTLLRRIMGLSTLPVEQVSHLGLDDFSFRRGRRFGTILVDLQSHQVIDLLPDRAIETVAAWLSAHPEIRLISRDRGGDYAAAARKSAPQAIQTADRFHISKNLTEAVELALARCRTEIRNHAEITARREVSEAAQQALGESRKTFALKTWKPSPDPSAERARLTRRTQRYDRYQQVVALHAQGFQQTEIADRVGLTTRTIQTWLKAGTFPEAKQRRKQQSQFDPYAAYVLKRWEEGCKNVAVKRDFAKSLLTGVMKG